MSDTEVFGLIFAPGFSTAEAVTDVSGRGVGMDVVKRNIAAMGGTVEIRSALGFGTTISIALPLTLAILDGMSVALGNSLYVVPLNLIVETLQPVAADIKTVTGEGHMVHVRGEYLPIIPLHRLFNQYTEITDPTDGVLVLIESEGKKSALFVDRLVGQQQVVIKSLETNFKKIPGVSGATIMGDGSVALIVDVPAIIQMVNVMNTSTEASTSEASSAGTTTAGEYLTFVLGEEEYGLDILKVQEIRGYDAVTQIANTPDFIKRRCEFTWKNCSDSGRVVGIVVDGVSDVMALKDEQLRDVPSLVTNIDTKYIVGLATVEEQMLILVDIEKLMKSEEMELIDTMNTEASKQLLDEVEEFTTLKGEIDKARCVIELDAEGNITSANANLLSA
ncbi:Chemotaxis protein CheA [Nymphon striatum]|nr:Chemotaxis protein CheA [Nymphon striatum]